MGPARPSPPYSSTQRSRNVRRAACISDSKVVHRLGTPARRWPRGTARLSDSWARTTSLSTGCPSTSSTLSPTTGIREKPEPGTAQGLPGRLGASIHHPPYAAHHLAHRSCRQREHRVAHLALAVLSTTPRCSARSTSSAAQRGGERPSREAGPGVNAFAIRISKPGPAAASTRRASVPAARRTENPSDAWTHRVRVLAGRSGRGANPTTTS